MLARAKSLRAFECADKQLPTNAQAESQKDEA